MILIRSLLKETILSFHQAEKLGEKIGIQWNKVKFTPEQLLQGFKVELEHGSTDKQTDVTHGDPIKTAKIAWAHLKEKPDYYQKLKAVEL
jgi:hypothetical protein